MSEQLRESLSALMDDEANELELQRLLKQVNEDSELRSTWVRYNAARSAMSGQEVSHMQLDISSRVREAIDGSPGEARSLRDRLFRPVASFAVAASVAATVVIGGQQLTQINGKDIYAPGAIAAGGVSPVGMVNSLGATTVQASYGAEAVPMLQPAARTAYKELARQRMQMYIQEHAEHAALNSPHGLIPFARVPEIRE
ncbi:sigma-E factor negative regulatory protein [Pseudohalioglobus lutimaris]|uniref:Anti-anti-sigma factor n=1 Tax=Pseudohalioglobus lutimaris TaxID=1737061 RepID=A0A2N5X0K7_9GAMM|nr:sigma-E factor negative regulatory protein [Pseudohalioglobus lutimaris]PLW68008.1 anti-anti-sigma factor [Pseudohalioglobus lutimaris]